MTIIRIMVYVIIVIMELMNPKGYRKDSMYFDCLDGKFYFNVTSGRKATVLEIISAI